MKKITRLRVLILAAGIILASTISVTGSEMSAVKKGYFNLGFSMNRWMINLKNSKVKDYTVFSIIEFQDISTNTKLNEKLDSVLDDIKSNERISSEYVSNLKIDLVHYIPVYCQSSYTFGQFINLVANDIYCNTSNDYASLFDIFGGSFLSSVVIEKELINLEGHLKERDFENAGKSVKTIYNYFQETE